MTKQVIAIDGASGTVGLTLMTRLQGRPGLKVVALSSSTAAAEKRAVFEHADLAVLCLPEEAARATAAAAPPGLRILDASPAHRTADGWVYGLPELSPGQAETIRLANRVANPGCYATGAILLLRPLSDVLSGYPVSIAAVGGYTSGGKRMVAEYDQSGVGFKLYGLNLAHRHVPEIVQHAQLQSPPVFLPAVAGYARGTLVQVPLHLPALGLSAADVVDRLTSAYAGTAVKVLPLGEERFLDASALAGSDATQIRVLTDPTQVNMVLVAQFDNLGKGAAGAALQNLELMLGCDIPPT